MKLTACAVIVTVVLAVTSTVGCGGAAQQQARFEPLGSNADWQPQDWEDSQGIRGVRLENRRLALDAHLVGQHDNYSKGEAYLDLRFYPGLEGEVPIDLRKCTITVEVEAPAGFVGWGSAPNGVQVFVKDANNGCQYSEWQNVEYSGKHTITLQPTARDIPGGYTKAGFDPSKICIIGVKFAIGSRSSARYDGPLHVNRVTIAPEIALSAPPPLPASTPAPVLSPQDKIEVRSDGFYLNGARWFIVGGNWRAIEYGQNFGATKWFPTGNGASKHPNFLRANLDDYRRAGVKVLRVGLLEDGRTMFDRDGHVTGYDAVFEADIQKFLDLVASAGLRVEFTLVDFLLAGKSEELHGVVMRGRSAVISDETRTNEFIDRFLIPFLREFGNHRAVIGFDVINEPEWVVAKADGGGWEDVKDLHTKADTPVPGEKMSRFLGKCIQAVHDNARGKLVTVGVSCTNLSLVQDLDLDYYAVHHYDWMGDLRRFAPTIPGGKPWLLEEYPTAGPHSGITRYLDLVSELGGSGALLWKLTPGTDDVTFPYRDRSEVLFELRKWVDEHAGRVYAGKTHASSPKGAASARTQRPTPRRLRPKGPAAVGSPDGSVPFGAKAYAPNGLMFAREVAPVDHGMIGIFDAVTHEQLHTIDTEQHPQGDFANELKGLAWSPNSELIAMMYHHGDGGHISVVRVNTGKETQWIDLEDWYHDLAFSRDGRSIRAGEKSFRLK